MEKETLRACSGGSEWGEFLLASRVECRQTRRGRPAEGVVAGRAGRSKGPGALHGTSPVRILCARARLLTNGPMLDLNSVHWEVIRVPGSQHCTCRMCRCSDQTVRLGQRNAEGSKLPPPLTSLSALRSLDRQNAETFE